MRFVWIFTILCQLICLANAQTRTFPHLVSRTPPDQQIAAVKGLIGRLIGESKVALFNLAIIGAGPEGNDVFEIETTSRGGSAPDATQVTIRGTTGVAIASGFNWYLKYYCNCHVSWGRNGTGDQLNVPSPLPSVSGMIRKASQGRYRYYMNVCTLSYSAAWWDWTRWEREIDWMALNAINMPLSFTGQEYVWDLVFQQIGFTRTEIDAFLSGPAFLAWNRMGNIKMWGGPMTMDWKFQQANLQKLILERQRSFGMIPVLPAFAGHVPDAITRIFPKANVTTSAEWAGFPPPYSKVLLLEPLDATFQTIGQAFIKTQTSVFGTDHIYNADTYNEMEPQSNDPAYLKLSSAAVYHAMSAADPQAVWLMQGWLFLDEGFWGTKQVQGYLSGVPDSSMIILDLDSLRAPQWIRLQSYYGKPWIWCLLHNFGGNRRVYGDLQGIATAPFQAANTTMIGTGLTPEAIEQNPVVYELMTEITWYDQTFDASKWAQNYAERRYGVKEETPVGKIIEQAWSALYSAAYSDSPADEDARGILERAPEVTNHMGQYTGGNCTLLVQAARLLVQPELKTGPYLYDVVDVVRQVLADFFYDLYGQLYHAYQTYDTMGADTGASVASVGKLMLELLQDLDEFLGSNSNYMLGLWIQDALRWGANGTQAEKNLYNFNARNQITLWGPTGQINDYAAKHWSGLVGTYYRARWNLLVNTLTAAIQQKKKVDWSLYSKTLLTLEQQWNNDTTNPFPVVPKGDTVLMAKNLLAKYASSTSEYTVSHDVDSPGNDMQGTWTKDVAQLKILCDADPACKGFNSNGWIKTRVEKFVSSPGTTFYTKNK